MDGKRIQDYWSKEIEAMLSTYKQFETLLPAKKGKGSSHHPEDGRYAEDLVKEVLTKFLPRDLEVLTGFILKAAVKTNNTDKDRKGEKDQHSTQLDLIVYDSANYPIYQRFGDTCIVPPEGVIAVVSVKKHLRSSDIAKECTALQEVSKLCKTTNESSQERRRPYLALIGMSTKIECTSTIFEKMKVTYEKDDNKPDFDEFVGLVSALKQWSIFKGKPTSARNKVSYSSFTHANNAQHLGLQFLLTGIFSVFYDKSRRNIGRPGFTAFSKDTFESNFEKIACKGT